MRRRYVLERKIVNVNENKNYKSLSVKLYHVVSERTNTSAIFKGTFPFVIRVRKIPEGLLISIDSQKIFSRVSYNKSNPV